jgi:hypothetical protein
VGVEHAAATETTASPGEVNIEVAGRSPICSQRPAISERM